MRNSIVRAACIAVALSLCSLLPARGEEVSEATARIAAENYVRLILAKDGAWGESPEPRVAEARAFVQNGRRLGFFFPVEPVGHIVVPLHREFPPILAYSIRSNANPDAESGMMRYFKDRLEQSIAEVERTLGRAPDRAEDFAPSVRTNFRAAWDALTSEEFDPSDYNRERGTRGAGMDYQEGDTMIRTEWHQAPPYNDDCPDEGCSFGGYGNYNTNVVVGCVATAGSQILKYWGWPPTGVGGDYADSYDYANMRNFYRWHAGLNGFIDENGDLTTEEEIRAVAEICHEFGVAVSMDYGCSGSSAWLSNVEWALQDHFRYSDECDHQVPANYSEEEWFELMKAEFNQNRVVEYAGGPPSVHAIVCDGWKEEWIGQDYMWIHGIYGNDEGIDDWYALWNILSSDWSTEEMIREIVPDCALGTELSGTVGGGSYGYVYFDRDVRGVNGIIMPGTKAQVLGSGFLMENIGTEPTDALWLLGQAANGEVKVFINGDEVGDSRIRLYDGALKLKAGGQMAIY